MVGWREPREKEGSVSQKMTIQSIKHTGAPVYLGEVSGTDSYTGNPERIAKWLTDGWRTRFNQHRSNRSKYEHITRANGDKQRILVPLGSSVQTHTDREAREQYSHLSALPAMVIQSAERVENTEWWASVARRKTVSARGGNSGSMPRFKSYKRDDHWFVCWFNGGSNATFKRTGRRSGVVTVTGKNPPGKRHRPGAKASWALQIRVRTSMTVKPYTSAVVNLTKGTVVLVNEPDPLKLGPADKAVGIDRGGVAAIATSDGDSLTPDKAKINKWDRRRKFHQAQMGKMNARAKVSGQGKAVRGGVKYQHHKSEAAKYSKRIAAYRKAWAQEATTKLVRENGVFVLEDLNINKMTAKGGASKKGMNRVFLSGIPGTVEELLVSKATRAGGVVVFVPPAYTSQRCHSCGYTSRDNRESQAVFLCVSCGHGDNADINAAKNIRSLYEHLEGTDLPAARRKVKQNGDGAVIRLNPSSEDVRPFFNALSPANGDDVINPQH